MGGGPVGEQTTEELVEKELGKLKEQVQKEGKASCIDYNSELIDCFVKFL